MTITIYDPVSKGAQRFEIFTGAGKRREWPPEIKAAIVTECFSGREGVCAVARRHGLDPSQVYAWRKDLLRQRDDNKLSVVSQEPEAAFVPAVIEPGAAPDPAPVHRASRRRHRAATAAVELEIDGVAVKIARGADAGVIAAVIEALKATR